LKKITRGFLLGIKNEDGKKYSIVDGVLYSYNEPMAWFKSKKKIIVDKTTVNFSRSSKKLFDQLERDMSTTDITIIFINSDRAIVKEPNANANLDDSPLDYINESLDTLLNKLQ